jgi:4-amino-4-deoxy-L-arabinose transferase-like glycosyltransferase
MFQADETRRAAADIAQAIRAVPTIYLAGLAVVTLIGSALRLHLVSCPLRTDESFTFLIYAMQPVWVSLSLYSSPNNHMLHSALVHGAYVLFGNHEWAIRLPAVTAGILVVPATFAVFAGLADYTTALLASALVAGSEPLIAYSANARGYSQATLLMLLLVLAVTYCKKQPRGVAWIAVVAFAIVGLYSLVTMAYGVAVVWAWMAIDRDEQQPASYRELAVSGVAVAAITTALYVPAVVVSGWRALFANPDVSAIAWPNFVSAFPGSLAATWFVWHRNLPPPLTWALIFGFGAFVIAATVQRRMSAMGRLLLAVVAVIGVMVVAQRVAPPTRVWLFLNPLFLGFSAAGLCSLVRLVTGRVREGWHRRLEKIAVIAIAGVCVWMALPLASGEAVLKDNEASNIPQVAEYLRDELHGNDAVMAVAQLRLPLAYYLFRNGLATSHVTDHPDPGVRRFVVLDTRYTPDRQTDLGQAVFNPRPGQRLVLLKKINSTAVYEIVRDDAAVPKLTRNATSVAPKPRRRPE